VTLTYVVDCSLVIDALSAREEDEVLRQRLSAPRTLHAPHHLDVEVASTVRGLAAGKKITDHRGEQMLADYARLRITRHPVWPYHPRMWELRHNLGAYDAAYIALAEALGCELLTGDVKLKNAAGHHATVNVTRLPGARETARGHARGPRRHRPGRGVPAPGAARCLTNRNATGDNHDIHRPAGIGSPRPGAYAGDNAAT
jgi:predicted nucleic acid-binding protein